MGPGGGIRLGPSALLQLSRCLPEEVFPVIRSERSRGKYVLYLAYKSPAAWLLTWLRGSAVHRHGVADLWEPDVDAADAPFDDRH